MTDEAVESASTGTVAGISADDIAKVFGPETAKEAAAEGLVGEVSEAPPEEGVPADKPKKEASVEEAVKQERAAARLLAARKKEIQLAKQREEINKAKAELDDYRAKIEKIKSSPLDAIREIGLEPTEFLQRVVNDGKATPEDRIAQLEQRLERQEQERKQLIAQQEEQFRVQHIQREQQAFIAMVETDAEKYPTLIEMYDPDDLANRALQVATKWGKAYFNKTGQWPTNEVIAEYLEQEATERKTARSERIERLLKGKSAKSESSRADGSVSKTSSPRTLTNRDSSHRVTPPGRHMTQKERDEESLRLLRAAGMR